MVLHCPFFGQLNPNLSLLIIYIYIIYIWVWNQYLLIPFLGGWTSIYQLFWCELQGYYWFWHTAIYIYIYIYIYILPSFSSSQPPLDSLKSASNVDFWGVALLIPIGLEAPLIAIRAIGHDIGRGGHLCHQVATGMRPVNQWGCHVGKTMVKCLPCPNGWCQWHCFTHIDMCWSKNQKWCRVVIFFSDRDVNKHGSFCLFFRNSLFPNDQRERVKPPWDPGRLQMPAMPWNSHVKKHRVASDSRHLCCLVLQCEAPSR